LHPVQQQSAAVVAATAKRSAGVDRRFYIGVAIVAILTSLVSFTPSIVNQTGRNAPLTSLIVLHSVVFSAWLLVFLAQTTLAATRRINSHRRLGAVSALLAIAMIVLGYMSSIAMVRRGFDLSGDLNVKADPLFNLIFPLQDLFVFAVLVAAGYWFRHRSEIHKRLMVLAVLGGLMGAPLAHLIGHSPALRSTGPIILIPIAIFLFASAVYDRVSLGRIHPVSLGGAIAIFVFLNLGAMVIGPSAAWHRLAGWLVR
jgi:hypothetical protein